LKGIRNVSVQDGLLTVLLTVDPNTEVFGRPGKARLLGINPPRVPGSQNVFSTLSYWMLLWV
jgi:hypothetical protein